MGSLPNIIFVLSSEGKMMAVLLRFFLFLSVTLIARAQEDPSLTNCPANTENYTSGSQYETNLKALLPSLALNGVYNIDTYYDTTVGRDPNRIYGYAQCMSASTAGACGACLNKSVTDMDQLCPKRKRAAIRYYSCIIRYSDEYFFSKYDDNLTVNVVIPANTTQPVLFNRLLSGLMKNLTEEAAAKSSRLAWGRTNDNDFSQIYGLAQCMGDLPPDTCTDCLSQTVSYIPSCCENMIGAQIYLTSCSIRYEIGPFDPASRLPPPSPPASSSSDPPNSDSTGGGSNTKRTGIIVAVSISVALACGISIVVCIYLSRRRKKWNNMPANGEEGGIASSESFLLFDFSTLRTATDDFSPVNKLGRGGFGPVYKGKLPVGQEIAVKRLLTSSSQGIAELRNEVALVAKLQHRNLVRIFGCCIQEEEKLLVYEYVPNSSLDKFLFDRTRGAQLEWDTRSKIIGGIARGLLYLHEDSRLRIVHLDLKPGNVLLDKNMNPKISDFGLAKLVQEDETEGNTNSIAGTYGYMAPEYLMQGQFSSKSDVFSFGVLVLEIVTGRKHSHFAHEDEAANNLLDHIWKHWTEERVSELIDQTYDSNQRKEALRCIHLGLLCVQEDPMQRPSMSTVVLLLSSQLISIPAPSPPPALWLGSTTRPSFVRVPRRTNVHPNENSSQSTRTPRQIPSINLVTVSELEPR